MVSDVLKCFGLIFIHLEVVGVILLPLFRGSPWHLCFACCCLVVCFPISCTVVLPSRQPVGSIARVSGSKFEKFENPVLQCLGRNHAGG